jgi:DNA (cytosine-5)-methyltransferase 1
MRAGFWRRLVLMFVRVGLLSLVKLKVLDLFSGIGGFSLGLERTNGFETVAFCEIEPFPRAILAKHWPGVPCYDDVRTLTASRLAAGGIVPDVICGGFPCQDISAAGLRIGIQGARSGLWSQYSRLIGELRPRWVIVENVADLLVRGMGVVLGDLAAIGYDAEWHCISASAIGADHIRDRVWIIAHSNGAGDFTFVERWRKSRTPEVGKNAAAHDADDHGARSQGGGVVQKDRRKCGRHQAVG